MVDCKQDTDYIWCCASNSYLKNNNTNCKQNKKTNVVIVNTSTSYNSMVDMLHSSYLLYLWFFIGKKFTKLKGAVQTVVVVRVINFIRQSLSLSCGWWTSLLCCEEKGKSDPHFISSCITLVVQHSVQLNCSLCNHFMMKRCSILEVK